MLQTILWDDLKKVKRVIRRDERKTDGVTPNEFWACGGRMAIVDKSLDNIKAFDEDGAVRGLPGLLNLMEWQRRVLVAMLLEYKEWSVPV